MHREWDVSLTYRVLNVFGYDYLNPPASCYAACWISYVLPWVLFSTWVTRQFNVLTAQPRRNLLWNTGLSRFSVAGQTTKCYNGFYWWKKEPTWLICAVHHWARFYYHLFSDQWLLEMEWDLNEVPEMTTPTPICHFVYVPDYHGKGTPDTYLLIQYKTRISQ